MKKAKDMDLVDFFAAVAMHALATAPSDGEETEEYLSIISAQAYDVAWAMMKFRHEDKHG